MLKTIKIQKSYCCLCQFSIYRYSIYRFYIYIIFYIISVINSILYQTLFDFIEINIITDFIFYFFFFHFFLFIHNIYNVQIEINNFPLKELHFLQLL